MTARAQDFLPSSFAREERGVLVHNGIREVPVFCANCGVRGPNVIDDGVKRFAFYQCDSCDEKYGEVAGMMKIPDDVHWEMQQQEQLAKYGRLLTISELSEVEKDGNSTLVKLAKDFK